MSQIEELQELIDKANNIVVITGAGISTASGIPDIRSANGAANNKDLIKKYKYGYETIVSHSFFMSHTDEFYRYYKEQMIFKNTKPNIAHKYLAKLESRKHVTIITQNIDGLHTVAGSKNVIEFHGSTQRNTCMDCGEKYTLEEVMSQDGTPHCKRCGGIIKPEVVLFEEGIDYQAIHDSVKATEHADLLIVIGSSMVVYPAAGIPNYFNGNNIVIINHDPTPLDSYAKLVIRDDIRKVFEQLI